MKNFKTYIQIVVLILVLFSSCVTDDSFFPDENTGDIVASTSVVTVLNNFNSESILPENQQCFKFVYPITLGYNTDATIRVDSYDGLVDLIASQGDNFNITGLQFPFQIIYTENDVTVTITDEASFLDVLRECQFDTVRDEFDQFFNSCFKFQYPVTLLNADQNEINITSDEEFQMFYQNQGVDYQPNFKFPVNLLVSPNFDTTTINTYYGFYRITASCEDRCPAPNFIFENINRTNFSYLFTAELPDGGLGAYEWFVDGQFIEADGPDNQGDNLLEFIFEIPGEYEVCIKAETDVCPEGIEVCKVIEVVEFCPELFFEFEQEPGTFSFTFFAEFEGINELTYQWFVDDQAVQEDGGPNGENTFLTNLEIGEHQVCIKSQIASCPNELVFCKEIIVEPICPDLSFTFEQEGNTSNYNFTADFQNIDTIMYDWSVNGELSEQDGGPNGDNTFFFQFDPGTYEICITAETPTCPNGAQFCETLVIP